MSGSVRRAVILAASGAALALLAAIMWIYSPPAPLPAGIKADRVLVLKSSRKLLLLREGSVLRRYKVALGGNPTGHKQYMGDQRTPEGVYTIDYRKADSDFHLALHISYPNEQDRLRASKALQDPGGLIMIHGLPNRAPYLGRLHRRVDWTDGCIALTNREIEQVWQAVDDGTVIEIRP